MDPNLMETLLRSDEKSKVEFKQKWYEIDHPDQEAKERQRGELIKDVLSLVNGNFDTVGETAYLIIGAGNNKNPDGTRQLFDVPYAITALRVRDLVNTACDPPVEELSIETFKHNGKQLLIVSIPPSPFLHETTRELKADKRTYTERTLFLRYADGVGVASAKQRIAIGRLKEIWSASARNVNPAPYGAIVGGLIGGVTASALGGRLTNNPKEGPINGLIAGTGIGGLYGWIVGSFYNEFREFRVQWFKASNSLRTLYVLIMLMLAAISISIVMFLRNILLTLASNAGKENKDPS